MRQLEHMKIFLIFGLMQEEMMVGRILGFVREMHEERVDFEFPSNTKTFLGLWVIPQVYKTGHLYILSKGNYYYIANPLLTLC